MDYQVLDGDPIGANLAEKDAAGQGVDITTTAADGYVAGTDNEAPDATAPTVGAIASGGRTNRALAASMGAMVLPALHGGGAYTKQIMLLLSVADEIGDAGGYKLVPAMTGNRCHPHGLYG